MNNNEGYERQDIPVKPVLIGGLLFIVTVLITLLLLYEYYIRVMDSATYDFKLSRKPMKLNELREFEKDNLNNYKELEEDKYQIPIERSKELMLNEQK
tara:strand:- start:476 stop:769 length:294 start_codon:yes stop_codon:yes gene_type:complete